MRNLRQRAAVLNAASANTLLHKYLPYLLGRLTVQQLEKLQRVLDAAVVNDSIQKEYKDVYRKSIIAKSGGLVMRDPNMIDRADNLADSMIRLSEDDLRIRLIPELLLSSDALVAVTNNPDEAKYLASLISLLHTKGVWLRITQPYVKDPKDLSQHMIHPRQFELWLSLGPTGESIPSVDGLITRESLLAVTEIGAGYYRQVFGGPVEYTLKKFRAQLLAELETVQEEHFRLLRRKGGAPIVGGIADLVGGADLPSNDIWERPNDLISKAMAESMKGNTVGCYAYLLAAAMVIKTNAKALSEYVRKSTNGADTAVTILAVVAGVGAVAGTIVTAYGVATLAASRGLITMPRLLAALGPKSRAGVKVVSESVDDLAKKVLEDYIKKNPGIADDLANVTVIKGPKGNIGGGIKPGTNGGHGGRPQFF